MKDPLSGFWLRPVHSQRSRCFFWILLILGPAAFISHFFPEPSPVQHLSRLVNLPPAPLNPLLNQLNQQLVRAEELGDPSNNHASEGLSRDTSTNPRGSSRHKIRIGRMAGIFPFVQADAEETPQPSGLSLRRGSDVIKTHTLSARETGAYGVEEKLARFWNISRRERRWERCPDQVAGAIRQSSGDAGFLKVICNGGLNQKRAAIADAVAIAWVMNRTLVVPVLETDQYWGDESGLSSIFNETHFISRLSSVVPVVREAELPANLSTSTRAAKPRGDVAFYHWLAGRSSSVELLVLEKFSHKLSYRDEQVTRDVQRIRCFANLEALKFTDSIEATGRNIVRKLRGARGSYVAVHLRFEQDMLAHAKCDFEGTRAERRELEETRENFWPYRNHRDNDTIEGNRAAGRCPLSPEEVGRLLHLLGFPPSTSVYIASGPIYKAEKSMPGLTNLFPNVVRLTNSQKPGTSSLNITSLLEYEERKRFGHHADQLAALDYFACAHADVFMPSFTGNMDFLLEGERRFGGFRTTIIPNRPRLAGILSKSGLSYGEAQKRVYEVHPPVQRFGFEPGLGELGTVLRHRHSVFSHPLPECLCFDGKLLPDEAYTAALADV